MTDPRLPHKSRKTKLIVGAAIGLVLFAGTVATAAACTKGSNGKTSQSASASVNAAKCTTTANAAALEADSPNSDTAVVDPDPPASSTGSSTSTTGNCKKGSGNSSGLGSSTTSSTSSTTSTTSTTDPTSNGTEADAIKTVCAKSPAASTQKVIKRAGTNNWGEDGIDAYMLKGKGPTSKNGVSYNTFCGMVSISAGDFAAQDVKYISVMLTALGTAEKGVDRNSDGKDDPVSRTLSLTSRQGNTYYFGGGLMATNKETVQLSYRVVTNDMDATTDAVNPDKFTKLMTVTPAEAGTTTPSSTSNSAGGSTSTASATSTSRSTSSNSSTRT